MARSRKDRRAAAGRRRATRRTPPRAGRGSDRRAGRAGASRPDLGTLLLAAIDTWGGDEASHDVLIGELEELAAGGAPVAQVVQSRLDLALEAVWRHGWAPADVVHVCARRLGAAAAAVARAAVVDDGRRRVDAGRPPHARWQAEVDALAESAGSGRRPPTATQLRTVVAVLAVLSRLPAIPPVMPHPDDRLAGATEGMDQRVLARVRGLLAKAESTAFDEEAEALTAKAQELITRHAIDRVLDADDDAGEPSLRRVPVDAPYADAKANLVAAVARPNRSTAVHSPDLGWVTVVGFDGDLDAVEVLSTSLLAQATHAMARQGTTRGRDGRSTTRSYRRAFLFGFATRIGERLRAASVGEVRAAGQARLLPALAALDDRVDAAVSAAFPAVQRRASQVSNASGWAAGQAAADLADLGTTGRRLRDGH